MGKNNQLDAMEIFLRNKNEAENYLSQYGEAGQDRNKGVTLSYDNIAQNDPLFIWFSAAALGSVQVGKIIDLINNPILHHCESTNTISLGFSFGNQKIHNNITALYYTYQEVGLKGLEELLKLDKGSEFITFKAFEAFEGYSKVQFRAQEYASEIHFPPTHLTVIKQILKQPENLQILKEVANALVAHEQAIVNPMYEKSFHENGKTVGETLNDSSYLKKLAANKLELSGAKILDKYISVDGYDFTIYEQRIAYFDRVFDEYFKFLHKKMA